jgi:hypothetical protein
MHPDEFSTLLHAYILGMLVRDHVRNNGKYPVIEEGDSFRDFYFDTYYKVCELVRSKDARIGPEFSDTQADIAQKVLTLRNALGLKPEQFQ